MDMHTARKWLQRKSTMKIRAVSFTDILHNPQIITVAKNHNTTKITVSTVIMTSWFSYSPTDDGRAFHSYW